MFIGINNIAPYAILQPPRINENIKPGNYNLRSSALNIITHDSLVLKGYFIEPKTDTAKGVVLFVHGIGGCKEHCLGLSEKLANMGIASLVFDSRAHGKSGGKYCTYGYKEKKDVSKIVDLIKNKYPDLKIGIWGNSLGGAVAIQALEYDERIGFGIIESTFTDLDQIVFDYQKRLSKGFGIRSISNYVLKRAGNIGSFDPKDVCPLNAVKNIEQPVLIAHGDADKNISVKYGKLLFENLRSKNKELVIVKGGEHFGLFETGGKEYKNKVFDFIENSLKN